jgi:hypothetical protein
MRMPGTTPRVVAVVTSEVQPRIRALLPGCELRFVRTGSDLVHALDEAHCALMIVEVHFAESTATAALLFALAREETFRMVCVRGVPSAKPRAALNAVRRALGSALVEDFIDLLEHRDDDAGNARVRAMLERLLPLPASLGARDDRVRPAPGP